ALPGFGGFRSAELQGVVDGLRANSRRRARKGPPRIVVRSRLKEGDQRHGGPSPFIEHAEGELRSEPVLDVEGDVGARASVLGLISPDFLFRNARPFAPTIDLAGLAPALDAVVLLSRGCGGWLCHLEGE